MEKVIAMEHDLCSMVSSTIWIKHARGSYSDYQNCRTSGLIIWHVYYIIIWDTSWIIILQTVYSINKIQAQSHAVFESCQKIELLNYYKDANFDKRRREIGNGISFIVAPGFPLLWHWNFLFFGTEISCKFHSSKPIRIEKFF